MEMMTATTPETISGRRAAASTAVLPFTTEGAHGP